MTDIEPGLVYFADPMCSWCWGFSPSVDAIEKERRDLPIRIVVGGLRPFTEGAMDAAMKERTRSHWDHVAAASGQPFDYAFFEREGFVYDTEPACRAVVAARRLTGSGLTLHRCIQKAFYAENRDVTDASVLSELAHEIGIDRRAFEADFSSEAARQETLGDFALSQRSGVTGFPTLVAGPQDNGQFVLISAGYQRPEPVLARLKTWLAEPVAG